MCANNNTGSETVPAGEENKNLDNIKELYKFLIEEKFDRKDMLLALDVEGSFESIQHIINDSLADVVKADEIDTSKFLLQRLCILA